MLHLSIKPQLFTNEMISATNSYLSYILGIENEQSIFDIRCQFLFKVSARVKKGEFLKFLISRRSGKAF